MSGYGLIANHQAMVFDAERNRVYRLAMEKHITAESVVLDLGAGVGVLGLMAAQLGAKKVYLLDASPAVLAAKQIAKENGLSNVEIIHQPVEEAVLPEQVDIILSVFTGNFLLTEDLLPLLFEARDKWLKPNGVMLPDSATMYAAPVELPKYYKNTVERWSQVDQASGLNYQSVHPYISNTLCYEDFTSIKHRLLAEPQALHTLDFYTATKTDCNASKQFVCDGGLWHGWLGWFDMTLSGDILSTAASGKRLHWSQVFMPLTRPLQIDENESVSLKLIRPERGDFSWISQAKTKFKQSSFLSGPKAGLLQDSNNENYVPVRVEKIEVMASIVAACDGKTSMADIATRAYQAYPRYFKDVAQAKALVKALLV